MSQATGVALQGDEHVLHEFRPTWARYLGLIVLTVGLGFPIAWWLRRGVRYTVTDKRVIKHTGRLSTKTDEFRISDVKRIQTKRTPSEKFLSGGTITLDTGVDELRMAGVPDHDQVAASIREAQTSNGT